MDQTHFVQRNKNKDHFLKDSLLELCQSLLTCSPSSELGFHDTDNSLFIDSIGIKKSNQLKPSLQVNLKNR
jgi:hypothetical protein